VRKIVLPVAPDHQPIGSIASCRVGFAV